MRHAAHVSGKWLAIAAVVFFSAAGEFAAASLPLRTIALTGDVAPSTDGLVLSALRLDELVDATINDRGDVVYRSLLTPPVQREPLIGLWIDPISPGEPDRSIGIIQTRSPPGLPLDVRYSGVSLPTLDNSGTSFATEFVQGGLFGADDRTGVWLANPAEVRPLVLPGQSLPGYDPGETVRYGGPGEYSTTGLSLVSASSELGRVGLWRYLDDQPELIAIEGLPAEGFPGFSFGAPTGRINASGDMVLLTTARNGAETHEVLYRVGTDGVLQLLMSDGPLGGTPPGAPTGSEYVGLGDVRINDAGAITFASQYRTPTGDLVRGIWTIPAGETQPQALAIEGMPIPDGGGVFTAVLASALNYNLNAQGQVGFWGFVERDGEEVRSSWLAGPDGLQVLASEGDPAPMYAPGTVITDTGVPQLSDQGTAILQLELAGPDVTRDSDFAILYRQAGGELKSLLREGQTLEIGPGDLRVVDEWQSLLAETGRPRQINANDEIALRISFRDGSSGVFVFAIPEPASLWILLAVLPLIDRRRVA